MKGIVLVLCEHFLLMSIVGFYMAAGYCVQFGFQIGEMMNVRLGYLVLNFVAICFSCIFPAAQVVRKIFHAYFAHRRTSGAFSMSLFLRRHL